MANIEHKLFPIEDLPILEVKDTPATFIIGLFAITYGKNPMDVVNRVVKLYEVLKKVNNNEIPCWFIQSDNVNTDWCILFDVINSHFLHILVRSGNGNICCKYDFSHLKFY